uniref:Uncharacterized protein n=1 Tax=Ditylenchus dipsaci TaxID=166011 RepID=A0A915EBF7_9BILA
MGSKEELLKLVEEQKAQILTYENKLKSVVRAYKSIETEKKALEVALTAIAPEYNKTENETSSGESSSAPPEVESTSSPKHLNQTNWNP